jgi:DNA-directed RNA polymerase specialized sigma24 family protein
VRQGAEADFRGWVSSSRGRLRRTAFLLCGDWFLADDLVQDALTRMFSGWERVRPVVTLMRMRARCCSTCT